ncbi:MAG: hypothetical protein R8M45_03275 [Ghiorsea sp.]
MTTLIDYAEQTALENIRFRLANTETLAKDATNTLHILLASMAACFAYVVKLFEAGGNIGLLSSMLMLLLWLLIAAVLLLLKCIMSGDLPTPTNTPENIYQPEYTLNAIREVELDNIQARITKISSRNHHTALWLDRVRLMLLLSPVLTVLVWAVGVH